MERSGIVVRCSALLERFLEYGYFGNKTGTLFDKLPAPFTKQGLWRARSFTSADVDAVKPQLLRLFFNGGNESLSNTATSKPRGHE